MLLRLAWRNLGRNRRRTALVLVAMGLATAASAWTLCLYDGMLWDMIESATDLYYGHVTIAHRAYLEEEDALAVLPTTDPTVRRLLAAPEVVAAAPRLGAWMLVDAGSEREGRSEPAEVLGIDPERERRVTRLAEQVVAGRWLADAATAEAVIGQALARRLEVRIGDTIAIVGAGLDGSVAADLLRIVGIVATPDKLLDARLVLTGIDRFQETLAAGGSVHLWRLRLVDPMLAPEFVAHRRADPGSPVALRPWQEELPQIGQILQLWNGAKLVVIAIFDFALVLIVLNTLSMAFFERLREFAVMRAVGLPRLRLLGLMLLEGLLLAVVGGGLGTLVGAVASWAFAGDGLDLSHWLDAVRFGGTTILPRLRAVPSTFNLLSPWAVLVVLSVAVAYVPARVVVRRRPIETLREV